MTTTIRTSFDLDDLHRRLNYRLCTAMDMTKIGIVLDDMVAEGVIHPAVARTFLLQASALLTAMRNANSQHFGEEPSTPIR